MVREAIATGETVQIAFAKACEELGLDTTEAEIEILEQPSKKTFGLFGSNRPAKVRAYVEVPDKPQPAQAAVDYLKSILEKMDLPQVEVNVSEDESGISLSLDGEGVGFIIGHRGETLDALQYLTSLVANHSDEAYCRITLDVGNYREKRRETLEALGKKMAMRAVKTGRNSSLEAMNPYERRIIHTAVQSVEGAKSWSEGEDLARHVVIGPEGGERFPKKDNRRYSGRDGHRGGYDRDRRGSRPPRSSSSRENSRPRPEGPKADDPTAPIYGKITAKKTEE